MSSYRKLHWPQLPRDHTNPPGPQCFCCFAFLILLFLCLFRIRQMVAAYYTTALPEQCYKWYLPLFIAQWKEVGKNSFSHPPKSGGNGKKVVLRQIPLDGAPAYHYVAHQLSHSPLGESGSEQMCFSYSFPLSGEKMFWTGNLQHCASSFNEARKQKKIRFC